MGVTWNGATGLNVLKLVVVENNPEAEHVKSPVMVEKTALEKRYQKSPSVQTLLCAQVCMYYVVLMKFLPKSPLWYWP